MEEYLVVYDEFGKCTRYKIADKVPKNYVIWNIGRHMGHDDYVPFTLCEGYNIIEESLIAIKLPVKEVMILREAAGWGFNSVKDCKRKLKRKDSDLGRNALEILERISE